MRLPIVDSVIIIHGSVKKLSGTIIHGGAGQRKNLRRTVNIFFSLKRFLIFDFISLLRLIDQNYTAAGARHHTTEPGNAVRTRFGFRHLIEDVSFDGCEMDSWVLTRVRDADEEQAFTRTIVDAVMCLCETAINFTSVALHL